jgi:hypothetical protein
MGPGMFDDAWKGFVVLLLVFAVACIGVGFFLSWIFRHLSIGWN